jgi:hypothetical protein
MTRVMRASDVVNMKVDGGFSGSGVGAVEAVRAPAQPARAPNRESVARLRRLMRGK